MKQSEAAAFLPLIKAWSEGKTLQLQMVPSGEWSDQPWSLNFTEEVSRYRIKPEPIVRYGLVSANGISTHPSEAGAIEVARMYPLIAVKVVRLVQDLDYVSPTS